MDTILYIATFVLGTIIGSFLNVVILRYNTGKTIGGRSMCFSCGKTLKWNHMVPVFSYLVQMGKCAFCSSNISAQYPIVEVLTGFAFLALSYKITFVPILLLYFTVFSVLLVIAVYDYRHKIIPDGLVFFFIALSFLRIIIDYLEGRGSFTTDFFSGLVISLLFALLWFISEGKWMGFGDAKLALGIGWLLPFCQNASAIILSFFIGSIIGLLSMGVIKALSTVKGRSFNFDKEIPFAPFLIIATFITFTLGFDVVGIMVGGVFTCVGI